jgi:glycosyltransferase involved in cell wall biosynthesis
LVLPSSSEPWGLVVNEALSFGCPVIVSNRCGSVDLVKESINGYVFICGDMIDLTSKMMQASKFFNDLEITAKNCVDSISAFTPINAAKQIKSGLDGLLKHE